MKCMQGIALHRPRAIRRLGFTLIELMIVVAILGALAMFAIPSYRQYNMRANRSAAAQILLNIQNREEAYLLDARQYTNVLGSNGLNIKQDGWTCAGASATTCTNSFYSVAVTVTAGTPPTYSITATPNASYQSADGSLTLTSTGTRTRSAGDGKW